MIACWGSLDRYNFLKDTQRIFGSEFHQGDNFIVNYSGQDDLLAWYYVNETWFLLKTINFLGHFEFINQFEFPQVNCFKKFIVVIDDSQAL